MAPRANASKGESKGGSRKTTSQCGGLLFLLELLLTQECPCIRMRDVGVGVQHALVLAQQSHGRGISLHQGGMGGTARESLEPQCAGAGEEVQHPCPNNVRCEPVEEGLAGAVWRRAQSSAGRNGKLPPPPFTADNANAVGVRHQRPIQGSPDRPVPSLAPSTHATIIQHSQNASNRELMVLARLRKARTERKPSEADADPGRASPRATGALRP